MGERTSAAPPSLVLDRDRVRSLLLTYRDQVPTRRRANRAGELAETKPRTLTGLDRLVAFALLDATDDDGRARISAGELGARIGMRLRHVQLHLQALRAHGVLEIGNQGSAVYAWSRNEPLAGAWLEVDASKVSTALEARRRAKFGEEAPNGRIPC